MAPEILKAGKHEGYGMNVDVFSVRVEWSLTTTICGRRNLMLLSTREVALLVDVHLPKRLRKQKNSRKVGR